MLGFLFGGEHHVFSPEYTICMLTNNTQKFPFFYIFTNTYYFLGFKNNNILMGVMWHLTVAFLDTCISSENNFFESLPHFESGCLLLLLSCRVFILYIIPSLYIWFVNILFSKVLG